MPNKHGDFIWYELMTSDADAASRFYKSILGWSVAPSEQPDMDYRVFSAGDEQVGGFMALTADMTASGAQPCWAGYISVDDVDASVDAIKAAGGSVLMGPSEVPGVGPFAFVADPQGAIFYVMNDRSGEASQSFAATEPKIGHCAWNELASANPEASKAFYGEQFGWVQDGDMDMGPLGKYQFWWASEKRFMLGAVMPKMPEMPVSAWGFYFRVPDIDAAAEAIKVNGGTLFQEPIEIPGGDFSLNASDPQGAAFGLVGPRK
ncbi:MAG: VOC family protein [Sphingomonadaceae bacterium]|nr:VOC family protein [Sphingomonadaceae bacterium]